MLFAVVPPGKRSFSPMRKLWIVSTLVLCLLFVFGLALPSCGDETTDDDLVGVWADPTGAIEFEFKSDGTLVVTIMGEQEQTTYTAEDGKVSVIDLETGESSEVDYKVDGDTLTLGADGEEGTLVRKP
jgi:hypothetical protein